jgi:LEA14-like dessication related protein
MNKLLTCILPLFALFLLSSCAPPLVISEINVQLVEMKLSDGAPTTGTVRLKFINENVSPIAVSSATLKYYIDGRYVGTCQTTKAIGLPPYKESLQTLNILFENEAGADIARAALASGSINWRFENKLLIDIVDDTYTRKSENRGRLDITTPAK